MPNEEKRTRRARSATSGRRRRRLPEYEGELTLEPPEPLPGGGPGYMQRPKRSPITGESLAEDPNEIRRRRKREGRTGADAAMALLKRSAKEYD